MSVEHVRKALAESAQLKLKVAELLSEQIVAIAFELTASLRSGGKAIFCGNGGSAADSQHLATELIVRLTSKNNRQALPAISLTTNSSIITACANDYGFDQIFSRQIEALGQKGDILFAISTSGNSKNIINAVFTANEKGLTTVGFLGCNGGKLAAMVNHPLVIPSVDVQRIQECHIAVGHIIISLAEKNLFPSR